MPGLFFASENFRRIIGYGSNFPRSKTVPDTIFPALYSPIVECDVSILPLSNTLSPATA